MNFTDSIDKVYDIIIGCINKEVKDEEGLLNDVNTVINTYYNDISFDEPVIWITQQPSFGSENISLSRVMDFTIPFEFDCGVYDVDLGLANKRSQNLTTRVISSVLKNWRFQQKDLADKSIIKSITLNTFYPAGFIDVSGKSSKLIITGCILNINIRVDWNKCIRPDKFKKYYEVVDS